MFIALTFFVFFLVELLSRRRIHPIQYLLVSCGLILFYGLLLAISEHLGFGGAYLISAAAIVSLISAYSASIFGKAMAALRMGLFLTALYVYLYVMLQLENMALLFGTIGLFVALAIIMYVSRKINWYRSDEA
jgi:inner membrane protein